MTIFSCRALSAVPRPPSCLTFPRGDVSFQSRGSGEVFCDFFQPYGSGAVRSWRGISCAANGLRRVVLVWRGRRRHALPVVRLGIEPLEARRLLASADAFEPDDLPELAQVISMDGAPQQHSIHNGGGDIDWVRFTLASASDVLVQTT